MSRPRPLLLVLPLFLAAGLVAQLRSQTAPGDRELQRRVLHTRYADEQVHAALSQGDASEERRRELLRRQADVLILLADDFAGEAEAGRPEPGTRPLAREARQFAEVATRF